MAWSIRFVRVDCLGRLYGCETSVASMNLSTTEPVRSDGSSSFDASSSLQLLRRARGGDASALDALFARHLPRLRRWARGRLPRWTRGLADTTDIVQDALLQTFRRLSHFEPRRDRALQAYLRMAVDNRIRDEIRRVARRPQTDEIESVEPLAVQGPSPLEQTIDREEWARYREGLGRLKRADQTLIVGRVELGYSHKQLALVSGRRGPEAARIALRRALVRLAAEMKHEG